MAVVTLLKIVSTIQDSANNVSVNTLSREKRPECPPITFNILSHSISKTRNNFVNWTCRKLSHIFSHVTFNSETVLGFGWRFQNTFVHCSPDTISPWYSNLESY